MDRCPYCGKALQVSLEMIAGFVVVGCESCNLARLSDRDRWVECGRGTHQVLVEMATASVSKFSSADEDAPVVSIFKDPRWKWEWAEDWNRRQLVLEIAERRKNEELDRARRLGAGRPVIQRRDCLVL